LHSGLYQDRRLNPGRCIRCIGDLESGACTPALTIEEFEGVARLHAQDPEQVMARLFVQNDSAVGRPGPWAPDPGSSRARGGDSVGHHGSGVKSRVDFKVSILFPRSPA